MRRRVAWTVLLVFVGCTSDPDGDGFSVGDGDCAPNDPTVYPGATEDCDGVDDDCDTRVDEDPSGGVTYYLDADEDGFGLATDTLEACEAPSGYVLEAGDCDDDRDSAYPGAVELCNEVDDDCDEQSDEGVTPPSWYVDFDGDGYGNDTPSPYVGCEPPDDGTEYVQDNTDCNDANPRQNPGESEVCDGIDGNCDGVPDDGLFEQCPHPSCEGVSAGAWYVEMGTWSRPEEVTSVLTECNGSGSVLWTSELAQQLGVAGLTAETGALVEWITLFGRDGLLFTMEGDPTAVGCSTVSGAALMDLPFEVGEMAGEIQVAAPGTDPADDNFDFSTSGFLWAPDPFVDSMETGDCPGGLAIGVVGGALGQETILFHQPGTWGADWSSSTGNRLVAPPGTLSSSALQLRMAAADHSKASDSEIVFITWNLWLKPLAGN